MVHPHRYGLLNRLFILCFQAQYCRKKDRVIHITSAILNPSQNKGALKAPCTNSVDLVMPIRRGCCGGSLPTATPVAASLSGKEKEKFSAFQKTILGLYSVLSVMLVPPMSYG